MKKPAFTMLELVLVIVVIGILATLAIPRLDRDLRQEAADNILSAIRYTQHLALMDDKHMFNNVNWQRRFWHIYMGTCEGEKYYAVGSDNDMTGSTNARVEYNESALDPANGKHLWAVDGTDCSGGNGMANISPSVLIGKKYGVDNIGTSDDCPNMYIGFDHLGRPYNSEFVDSTVPDNDGLITDSCVWTFTLKNEESFQISIAPETGYAHIVGQEGY